MDETKCLNCQEPIEGNYCSNCGQSTQVERFDWGYLGRKLVHSIDIERGFFHTLLLLIKAPGSSIRDFLEGHRIGYSNPIRLFLILGAISTYITLNYKIFIPIGDARVTDIVNLPDLVGYYQYSSTYFSFFTLTGIPFFGLLSWLFYRKEGFNYVEHLILNFYIAVGQFLIVIFMSPIIIYWKSDILLPIYGVLNFAYNIWAIAIFFRSKTIRGWIVVFLAVGIPQVTAAGYNYLVYRMSPKSLWVFLDAFLG